METLFKNYYNNKITISMVNKYTELQYYSFEELLKLENYNDITFIVCSNMNLTELPELPSNLTHLHCEYNKLTKLPKLPNGLINLYCNNNKLSKLPELPNKLYRLDCENNELINLPQIPNSVKELNCNSNRLLTLPILTEDFEYYHLKCLNNPVDDFIWKYFKPLAIGKYKKRLNRPRYLYNMWNREWQQKFVRKIENWFLECKYNPKYKFCRKRLILEYEELYEINLF